MPPKRVKFVQFGVLTAREILSLSAREVTTPCPQGETERCMEGTPYDLSLGALENGVDCMTCGENNRRCPGHWGHIKLPVPIYNRAFLDVILKILNSVCPHCSQTRLSHETIERTSLPKRQSKRLAKITEKSKDVDTCPWPKCMKPLKQHFAISSNGEDIVVTQPRCKSEPFRAGEALHVFRRISHKTTTILGFNAKLATNPIFTDEKYLQDGEKYHVHQFKPESLIFTIFPVSPSTSRPYVVSTNTKGMTERKDDDITTKYNDILKSCIKLKSDDNINTSTMKKGRQRGGRLTPTERQKTIRDLQNSIWTMMFSKEDSNSTDRRPTKSILQRLKGKDGRAQGNVLGKRADFSARTVIDCGGISLKLDYVGVPQCIADELTKKVLVKEWNFDHCVSLIRSGQVKRVVYQNGSIRNLSRLPDNGRNFTPQIGDVIERVMQDGDVFLFNRQPTLRSESIQGVKAKVIPNQHAITMPSWICTAFNADFDGKKQCDRPQVQGTLRDFVVSVFFSVTW